VGVRSDVAGGGTTFVPRPARTEPTSAPSAAPTRVARKYDRRDPDRPTRRLAPAGHILLTLVTCLLLWLFVAAPSLEASAKASDVGARRSVSLAVLGPIARAASFLGLDRLRTQVDDRLGRTTGANGLAPGDDLVNLGDEPPPTGTPSAGPPPAGTDRFAVHPPTEANPVRVLTVGDSLGIDLALGMTRLLESRDGFRSTYDARISTGLARSDYFDWVSQVRHDVRQARPDVVVVLFGANDDQPFWTGTGFLPYGRPGWKPAYRGRVGEIMDLVRDQDIPVVWVGLPPMANERDSNAAKFLNTVYASAAAKRRGATFVDPWDLFLGPKGNYAAYLPDASGQLQLVRAPDGVHLTPAGYDRLARYVFQQMQPLWSGA